MYCLRNSTKGVTLEFYDDDDDDDDDCADSPQVQELHNLNFADLYIFYAFHINCCLRLAAEFIIVSVYEQSVWWSFDIRDVYVNTPPPQPF
jgi:hypothetical protein